MEIILAIVVASAVIIFGILISFGNEQQRNAIDGLREQVVLWAIQDLKIKREHLLRDLHISDPLVWFNSTVSKVYGIEMKLRYLDYFEDPHSLMFFSDEINKKILITTMSPKAASKFRKNKTNRLSQSPNTNPMFYLPKNVVCQQLSILNCGILFDEEVILAWKILINREIAIFKPLWIYEIP